MTKGEVHFEVFLKPSTRHDWRLVCAMDQRDAAISEARSLLKSNPAGSVRICKEVFEAESRAFRTLTIFEEGAERFDDTKRETRTAELPCKGPADLCAPAGREAIQSVLESWLQREKVVPLELLHRTDLVQRLEATGTELQHAVQKVAVARAQATQSSVQHFVKELNALIQTAVTQLYAETRQGAFPKMKADGFGALARSLTSRGNRERTLRGCIARSLSTAQGWADKLKRLFDLLDELAGQAADLAWATDIVESFVEEVLAYGDARRTLLAEAGDSAAMAEGLTELLSGDCDDPSLLSPLGKRLCAYGARGGAKTARAIIAQAVLDLLRAPRRLRPSDIFSEIELCRKLADRMIASAAQLIAVEDISSAFVIRSTQLVLPEAIDAICSASDGAQDTLFNLVKVEQSIVGQQNKIKLAAYIRGQLGTHATKNHFIYGTEAILQRLGELAEFVRRIDASGLPAQEKASVRAAVGDLALEAEAHAGVFDKLAHHGGATVATAVRFLRLAQSGMLPEGPLQDEARARARSLLGRPDVRQAITHGANDPALAPLIAELRTLMNTDRDRDSGEAAVG